MDTMPTDKPTDKPSDAREFFDALRKGVLIGAAVLVLVIPPMRMMQQQERDEQRARSTPPVATAPVTPVPVPPVATAPQPQAPTPQAPAAPELPPLRLADFGSAQPSEDVKLVANWAVYTRDNGARSIVVVDKKEAQVYVFGPEGRLKSKTPVLLGAAIGDHTVPGIGNKPLKLVKHEEKTTPAGRFIAEPGKNHTGEDVIWVDYEAAVSMHRLRPTAEPKERRPQRMASATPKDNRISFGCINVPVAFYEGVLSPAVRKSGAVIYVLPEVRSPEKVFGAWDVTSPLQTAQRAAAGAHKVSAKAAVTGVKPSPTGT